MSIGIWVPSSFFCTTSVLGLPYILSAWGLESTLLSPSFTTGTLIHFSGKMVFRNQNLGIQKACYYWSVIAFGPFKWTHTHTHTCTHTCFKRNHDFIGYLQVQNHGVQLYLYSVYICVSLFPQGEFWFSAILIYLLIYTYCLTHIYAWRRAWQPTPVFLPGEFLWQRSLAVYSPWGPKESDMTERLSMHTQVHTHHTHTYDSFGITVLILPPRTDSPSKDFVASLCP